MTRGFPFTNTTDRGLKGIVFAPSHREVSQGMGRADNSFRGRAPLGVAPMVFVSSSQDSPDTPWATIVEIFASTNLA